MAASIPLTFLGTGNGMALDPERYWNSFLLDGRILVETSPIVLPHLRRLGTASSEIDVVFLSHFHCDHTFGWPFLLLDMLAVARRNQPLWVVGPPGVQAYLEAMLRAGASDHLAAQAGAQTGGFDLRYVDVTGEEQEAGPVRFRAVAVEHDPTLACYGYLIQRAGRTIGYSGDTRLCEGLRELAAGSDALVLECNQRHGVSPVHMNLDDVRTLRAEVPGVPFVLTHMGPEVTADGIADVSVPRDLETVGV